MAVIGASAVLDIQSVRGLLSAVRGEVGGGLVSVDQICRFITGASGRRRSLLFRRRTNIWFHRLCWRTQEIAVQWILSITAAIIDVVGLETLSFIINTMDSNRVQQSVMYMVVQYHLLVIDMIPVVVGLIDIDYCRYEVHMMIDPVEKRQWVS